MRGDQEIYNDIGAILLAIAPDNAKKIIMRAELSSEEDHCKYEYDYIDRDTQEIQWFAGGGKANQSLLGYLVELKKYWVANNLANNLPVWHGCEVTVDVESLKIHIDFKYD